MAGGVGQNVVQTFFMRDIADLVHFQLVLKSLGKEMDFGVNPLTQF